MPTRLTTTTIAGSKSSVKKKKENKSVQPAISSPQHDTNATLVSNYSKESVQRSHSTTDTSSVIIQDIHGDDKLSFVGSIEDKMKAFLTNLESTILSDNDDTIDSIESKLKACVDQTCFASGVLRFVAKSAINDGGGSRGAVKLLSNAIQVFLTEVKDESKLKVTKLLPMHIVAAKKQLIDTTCQ
jgi:hypothetical protein